MSTHCSPPSSYGVLAQVLALGHSVKHSSVESSTRHGGDAPSVQTLAGTLEHHGVRKAPMSWLRPEDAVDTISSEA